MHPRYWAVFYSSPKTETETENEIDLKKTEIMQLLGKGLVRIFLKI